VNRKIYFILPVLNGGGAERVTLNYINQFKNKNEFDVTLILFDKKSSQLDLLPDFIRVVDLKTKSTKKSFFALIKEISFQKSDIVFTSHSRVAVLIGIVRVFKSFIHIARMQNTPSLEIKHKGFSRSKIFLYKVAFSYASKVIAQTENMKDDAKKIFSLKDSHVVVLNNPLDKENINDKLMNSNSPFPDNELSIIMSGRLHKNKAYDVAIQALAKVVQEYSSVKLYILGYDEGEKVRLDDLILKLNLTQNIVFCDYTNNPYSYYNNAKLFILSSLIEGFPNTLIENYYLNTPIVSTRCIPIIETLVKDGINGYTVNVGDFKEMANKIILSIKNLDRKTIKNEIYEGSNLPKFLKETF